MMPDGIRMLLKVEVDLYLLVFVVANVLFNNTLEEYLIL